MVERYGGLAGGIVPADDGPWVRYSDYMVMEADRDFWKERLQVETRDRIDAEALSRTGAVKVTSAVIDAICADLIRETERAIAQRDTYLDTGVSTASHGGSHDTCFRPILDKHLSTLEPAAPDNNATMLSNLLARIHRDGGHYEAVHGTEKAAVDADDIVARIYADQPTTPEGQQSVAWRHPLAKFGSSKAAPPGLYRVHWKSGGSSLAAIGMMRNGDRWIAPTNWVRPGMEASAGEWEDIERLEPIHNTRPSEQAVTADWQRVDDALVSCAGLLRTLCRDEIGETAAAELEYVRSVIGRPSEQAVTEEWREIKQHVQPRIADGYTAVAISKPGYWFVKGPGPAEALKTAMEAGR